MTDLRMLPPGGALSFIARPNIKQLAHSSENCIQNSQTT